MRVERTEQGIAMVTAIMVATIVVLLGVVATSLAVHNTTASAQDRSRTQAIHTAEAGINRVINMIQKSQPSLLPCSVSGEIASALPSTYETTVKYYRFYPFDPESTNGLITCTPGAGTGGEAPRGAFLSSVGTVSGASTVSRTMQGQYRLSPILGGFNSAIFSDNGFGVQNSFELAGNQTFDGDIYTNGDWKCKSGSAVVYGSVYVQGTATSEKCEVKVDIWANGKVTLLQSAIVREDAISSTDDVDVSGANKRCTEGATGCAVERNASAGKLCRDCKTATNQGVKVKGEVRENNVIGPPPKKDFPKLRFIYSEWSKAGYKMESPYAGLSYTYPVPNCAAAQDWIDNKLPLWPEQNTGVVLKINNTCNLTMPNNAVIDMPVHLAIVTDGSITFSQQTTFRSSNSDPRNLYLIVPYYMHPDDKGLEPPEGPKQECPGTQGDISISNNTNFNNVRLSAYSPCTVNFENSNQVEGQIYGGQVNITNQANLKYNPLLIPGAGEVSGFNVDPAFLREVVNN